MIKHIHIKTTIKSIFKTILQKQMTEKLSTVYTPSQKSRPSSLSDLHQIQTNF